MSKPGSGQDAVERVLGVIRKTLNDIGMKLDNGCEKSFHEDRGSLGLNNDESFDMCLRTGDWDKAEARLLNAGKQHALLAASIQSLMEANPSPAVISFDAFRQAGVLVRDNCMLRCDGTNLFTPEKDKKGQWCTWP